MVSLSVEIVEIIRILSGFHMAFASKHFIYDLSWHTCKWAGAPDFLIIVQIAAD